MERRASEESEQQSATAWLSVCRASLAGVWERDWSGRKCKEQWGGCWGRLVNPARAGGMAVVSDRAVLNVFGRQSCQICWWIVCMPWEKKSKNIWCLWPQQPVRDPSSPWQVYRHPLQKWHQEGLMVRSYFLSEWLPSPGGTNTCKAWPPEGLECEVGCDGLLFWKTLCPALPRWRVGQRVLPEFPCSPITVQRGQNIDLCQ